MLWVGAMAVAFQDHGARAADTGAYFEAPHGGAMRGHRHAKESRNGRESGTEAETLVDLPADIESYSNHMELYVINYST